MMKRGSCESNYVYLDEHGYVKSILCDDINIKFMGF